MLAVLTIYAQNSGMERHHVRVTMQDGTTRDGYLKQYWFTGKLLKKPNIKFTMSSDSLYSDVREYSAESVSSVDFLLGDSLSRAFSRVESRLVANPSTLKPKKQSRIFIHTQYKAPIGEIYWWNGYDSNQMQLGTLSMSTIYGVRLRESQVIVPFLTGNVISLNAMRIFYKHQDAGLVEYLDKRVLKGGKRLWQTIADNPELFLGMCQEYYREKSFNIQDETKMPK